MKNKMCMYSDRIRGDSSFVIVSEFDIGVVGRIRIVLGKAYRSRGKETSLLSRFLSLSSRRPL